MIKKIFSFFFLFFFFFVSGYSMSLTLYNDSPYELTALIKSAGGKLLGQVILLPGEKKVWNTDLFSSEKYDIEENISQPEQSLTPYTVIWKCPHGDFYSVCSDIQPGSYVNANFGNGVHYCKPKEKEKKDSEEEESVSSP